MSNSVGFDFSSLPFKLTDFPPLPYDYINHYQIITQRLPCSEAPSCESEQLRLDRILVSWRDDLLEQGQQADVLNKAVDIVRTAYLQNSHVINLKGLGLFSVPQIFLIEKFQTNLKALDFSSNRISTIPSDICKLQNLEQFAAADNIIESFPADFESLTKLSILSVARNQLGSFPKCYSVKFENLSILDLSSNPLLLDREQIANLKLVLFLFKRTLKADLETNKAIIWLNEFERRNNIMKMKNEAFLHSKVYLPCDKKLCDSIKDLVLPVVTDEDINELF